MSPTVNNSREQILNAIRGALDGSGEHTKSDLTWEAETSQSGYARSGHLDKEDRLSLFQARVEEYDAHVVRIAADQISAAIRDRLAARSFAHVLIARGLPAEWLPAELALSIGDNLSLPELDESEGVITTCDVAIALTGTIVLQHGSGQGPRRLTLIPDYHLCVVFADQVVETVPEAFARLAESKIRPTTFISGPSATSDIEMTRIRGVHGPRTLDILLVV